MAPAIHDTTGSKGHASASGLGRGAGALARRGYRFTKVSVVTALAGALAACGNGADTLEAVQKEASAAAQESRVVEALDTAIDEQALEGLARGAINGAVNQAIGEVVPAEGIATVRAIVDEEAIAKSFGAQLDSAAKTEAGDDTAAQ